MIETRLLYYFVTVARECNISQAAKILHITQPTLSRQMALLEQEVGSSLFVRKNRPLTLTDEGILLYRRAEEILELITKAESEIASHEAQVEGTISIGCGELASFKLLTKIMAEFSIKYPRVKFDVYTANADQIKIRMDQGLTDIGLLLEPVEMERYEYIRMPIQERWAVVTPVDSVLAQKECIRARELVQVPIIMPSRQKLRDELANWFGKNYENLEILGTSNLSTNAAMMVHAGLGHALIVEGGFPFLEPLDVCMRPLHPELMATSVLAWKREQPLSTVMTHFVEFIQCFLSMESI